MTTSYNAQFISDFCLGQLLGMEQARSGKSINDKLALKTSTPHDMSTSRNWNHNNCSGRYHCRCRRNNWLCFPYSTIKHITVKKLEPKLRVGKLRDVNESINRIRDSSDYA
jgi:hypothetical protein